MKVSQTDPRKAPRQARSRATFDAILQAAGDILARDGQAGLNTNHVAQTAGVSIGSLYQYFPNKQAIVTALIRDLRAGMLADMERAAADADRIGLEETVRLLVRASLRHHLVDPARTEALERVEAELPVDPEVAGQKREIHALIVDVLARHYVDDPETVARDVIAMCQGIAHAAVDAGERDFEALAARLDRAVLGYLAG